MSKAESDQIRAKCTSIIDRFAHRSAIRDVDMQEWLKYVVPEFGEAATWHATRAGGFGGSDIGVLTRNFMGARADHQNSAHDILASKLLRSVPDEDTGPLRRGHANEPRHAEMYYAKYGAVRDVAAYNTLTAATGIKPWMRYSPDDVVLMPAPQPNPNLGGRNLRRLLIDYKAPTVVDEDENIAFQYSCQLHQGAMLCHEAKVIVDGLQLSQFDWAKWELKDDYIPYDAEVSRLILAAGDHYWQYALQGELPPYIFTPKFKDRDAYLDKFGAKAQTLAQISAMANAFKLETEDRAAELKEALKGTRLAGTKLQMGDLTVTAVTIVDHAEIAKLVTPAEALGLRKKNTKKAYDGDAMALKLIELGVDPKPYRVVEFDADKAYDFLVDKGIDPEAFMVEQIRMKVQEELKQTAIDTVKLSYPATASLQSEAANDEGDSGTGQDEDDSESNVREGQSVERPTQRTAMV